MKDISVNSVSPLLKEIKEKSELPVNETVVIHLLEEIKNNTDLPDSIIIDTILKIIEGETALIKEKHSNSGIWLLK